MAEWHCFKDKEPMVEGDVMMEYLDIINAIEGIKCPKCGEVYLLEETVVEKVSKAEEMLENK
ncbi:hypothetical protein ACFLV4_04590 [Chloroflexota bacterium]